MNITEKLDVLAPFEIWEVLLDNTTIKFHEPLILKPEILPPEEPGDPAYWTVDFPDLDISAVAVDRSELLSCVRSDIRMIWGNCVCKDDASLTPKNRTVKQRFLAIAEEIDG